MNKNNIFLRGICKPIIIKNSLSNLLSFISRFCIAGNTTLVDKIRTSKMSTEISLINKNVG
ncbi:hypothetical protein C8P67_10452 [Flavobacterium aquicola]|uniref:Uncharacterized protein n=1 Tax=Flavobacterium aquicola TaxID=1682742 RepID=A0A3E0EME4_9FLAO|nr:hypothetical protein C8P67_10452 [Flavobacterium aquicola]